jgi:glycerol-3-phosphate O-acyltransferase
MINNSKMNEDTLITPENIFQPAHKVNRDLLFEIVNMSHLEGSTILGVENLIKLYDLAKKGKSCLILSEHVSNLDVPSMFVRFYEYPDDRMKEIFEKIIFIAGVKLNENPIVKLYTEMFTRVVIYPIRSLSEKQDKEEYKDEVDLAKKINLRSTRKIKELREQGNIFVMYPGGTRYRPWKPETKKPVKETASYISSFDYFCCSSINGNNMAPMQHEDMTKEIYEKDVIVFSFGEIKDSKEYVRKIYKDLEGQGITDKAIMKEKVGDKIMEQIDSLHEEAEKYRSKYLHK